MKKFFINLAVFAISGLVFLLFLELVVFRFIFPASDIPKPYYADGLVRYQPGQEGTLRVRNEISAQFEINKNGWNSKHPEYITEKPADVYRVALIGDSYIAAFQVNYQKSVAEKLEEKLNASLAKTLGKRVEVYRFGMDGAPMSHYLYMMRQEVLKFKPDLVIVNLVHNDFNESYTFSSGVFKSSFLKYDIKDNQVKQEVAPQVYSPPWYSFIREESAIWRYLAYRQQVRFGVLRDLILGDDGDVEYWANIDVNRMAKDTENNYLTVDYTLATMKTVCEKHQCKFMSMMDADDQYIYAENTDDLHASKSVLQLNDLTKKAADKNQVPLIDLQPIFVADYKTNKHRFSFVYDGHWNEYSHNLVAGVLTDYINENIRP